MPRVMIYYTHKPFEGPLAVAMGAGQSPELRLFIY